MLRHEYQNVILRLLFRRSSWSKMCERIGAMPAPAATKHISLSVSLAKNSPKGPDTVTRSPGLSANSQELILPGGMSSRYCGGKTTRMVNSSVPFSSG